MPAISLAVGEPQHGVPSFVGPVLAAHIEEFGCYPMNRGLDEMCAAAAGWLGLNRATVRKKLGLYGLYQHPTQDNGGEEDEGA